MNETNPLLEIKTSSASYPTGEEAPEARAGPRNPDAFYRGEEAGAAPKTPTKGKDDNYSYQQARGKQPSAKS